MSTEEQRVNGGNESEFNIDLDASLDIDLDGEDFSSPHQDDFTIDLDSGPVDYVESQSPYNPNDIQVNDIQVNNQINTDFSGSIEIDLDNLSGLEGLGYTGVDEDEDEITIDFDETFEEDEDDKEFDAELIEGIKTLPSGEKSEDDDWNDSDFYTSNEAFEEGTKQVIEAVKTKKKKALVTLEESAVFNYNTLSKGVFKYPNSVMHYFRNKFNRDNSEKLLGNQIINAPEFLGLYAENKAFEGILSNPDIDLRELYNSLGLADIYRLDEAKFLTFSTWASGLRDYQIKNISIANYSENTMEHMLFQLLNTYIPFTLDNCSKIESKYREGKLSTLKSFISNSKAITHYVCPKCGERGLLPKNFMVFMYNSSEFTLIYDPVECSCGTLCIFSKPDYDYISKQFNPIFSKIRPDSTNPYQSLRSYVPSYELIESWLTSIGDVEIESTELLETVEEDEALSASANYSVDWEGACKDFLSFITMVGDSKFKLKSVHSGSRVNTKNFTKILVNQVSSYKVLKENALASLINTLMHCGLSNYSLYNKTFLDNLYNLKNVDGISDVTLEALNNALLLDVIRDKKVSRERFNEVLDLFRKERDSFDDNFTKFINTLERNKYSLSFIPVTTSSLREELLYNYFYDERLANVLDEISDLMLLNSVSEDLFNDISMPTIRKGSVKNNVSFSRAKSNLIDVNKIDTRVKYISKLLSFIVPDNQVSSEQLLLTYVADTDSLNVLADFLKACYNRDVYDIYKYYTKVLMMTGNATPNYLIKRVRDLVLMLPHHENTGDKFSFYFDFDCDRAFRAKFVRLYEEKGFIPPVIEGDTVEEKLEFYENCSSLDGVKNFVPDDVEKVLQEFSDVFTFGQFVDYHNLFRDYPSYMFMRDLIYYLSDLNIDLVLNLLSLDSTICSILLEDDYVLPELNPNVIRDFYLVTLPILDTLSMGGDSSESDDSFSNGVSKNTMSYEKRIEIIRKNYNNLTVSYKEIPCFIDIIEKSMGDVINDSIITGGQGL